MICFRVFSTVTIVDTLDLEKLDIMSLEILAGSHAYEWSIKEPAVLEVVFNNINLVDSSVSFTESQGFIKYRIQITSAKNASYRKVHHKGLRDSHCKRKNR